jgi:hypothetical protein
MLVAKASATAFKKHHDLSVGSDVAYEASCVGIIDHSAAGNVDIAVGAVGTM